MSSKSGHDRLGCFGVGWADKGADNRLADGSIGDCVVAKILIQGVIKLDLLHIGQNEGGPVATGRCAADTRPIGQNIVCLMVIVQPQANLFEIIDTLGTASSLSRGLNGWQKQRDQHSDDGNNNKQFN